MSDVIKSAREIALEKLAQIEELPISLIRPLLLGFKQDFCAKCQATLNKKY